MMKTLLLVSALILVFGAVSERLKRAPITPPMVFVGVGLAVGAGIFGTFGAYDGFELTRLLAELTLIVVLFTDASRIRFRELRAGYRLPLRLLAIAMPLSVVLGAVVAIWWFPNLSIWSACVLAAILVPTDAALGQAVVSAETVPIRIRQALNVESGLNDGLALPIVLVFAALANMHADTAATWLWFVASQITLGPLLGVIVGYAGGRLVLVCVDRKWMDHSFEQLAALALASILFAFLVLDEGVPGRDAILSIVVVTVLISVYAHGVTAWPAPKAYGRACDQRRDDAMEEWMPAPDLPTRLS